MTKAPGFGVASAAALPEHATPIARHVPGNHTTRCNPGTETFSVPRALVARGRNYTWTTAFGVPIEVRVALGKRRSDEVTWWLASALSSMSLRKSSNGEGTHCAKD